jgi:hypothetical protein
MDDIRDLEESVITEGIHSADELYFECPGVSDHFSYEEVQDIIDQTEGENMLYTEIENSW